MSAGEYSPSFRDRVRVRARRATLARFGELAEPAGCRLLDLGGGSGATTVVLGRGASELVVLEPEARRIARGRAARAPVTFVEGRAEELPWLEHRFERVVSLVAFHHFADGDRALREARRVLVPGGRLVVYDFDPRTARGRWLVFWEGRVLRHGLQFATPDQLVARATAAGFTSVRSEPFGTGAFVVGSV